jgi:anaerobic magnesium-protoporphyrin IX monomethyl ester cyclase
VTSIDVLLTHSNHLFYDSKQVQKMQPYPPLQTLLGAALLRQSGIQVSVLDATLDPPEGKLDAILRLCKPGLVAVCEDDFNFLSKMCLARNRELAFWTAKTARAHGCRTAVHGSDSSDHVQEYLQAGFDYVLIGEVEDTLLELASQRAVENIPGLAYRSQDNGRIHYNTPRPLRTDLDALPLPAWDLIDMRRYKDTWAAHHGYFSLNMVSSRGCPFRCNWCAKPIYGNSYQVRSPHRVAEEMLFLKQQYQPDHIWFADDIFALSGCWTTKFSNAVDRLQAQIPFKMQSRCDLMTRDSVQALKRAGCREVWMGAESGSQRILDAMDKGIRVEQIYQARANLAQHGIRAGWFLQFGYPGESWEDIEATIRMVRQTKPDDIGVSVSYPLPGTKFHQLVSSQIGNKTHWSESGDLAMIFRGAYSSEVYRALADALHLEVRAPESKGAIQNAWNRVVERKNGGLLPAEVAS